MAGGGGGTEELNLVPYLDIMVNLIMFMVVVTAYLVQLKEAPIMAPSYGPGGGGASGEQKAYLTVAITNAAIQVVGGGSASGTEQTLPKDDYAGLTAQLRSLKTAMPNVAESLVVTADNQVPYKDVVRVMDAARKDKQGLLFPNITLSVTVSK
jgi:biopolymer transport protein ExbD